MKNIQKTIKSYEPWFHNLHLPDGSQTAPAHPLGDFPLFKWKEIQSFIPSNLDGWRALDIGCNAGFYTFELARRGAFVTAIDIDDHYLEQAKWASSLFGLSQNIVFKKMQLYELSRSQERYDIVWFMGVLYHLRYPLLSLDIINRITDKLMVFQTMTIPGNEEKSIPKNILLDERNILCNSWWPKMAFVEKNIEDDPTNWWVPSYGCAKSLLRASGFKVIGEPCHETFICEVSKKRVSSRDLREKEYRAAIGGV